MKKILVVEDIDDLRENASELLEFNDFEVHTADNGLKALDVLNKEQIDLIISDIVMPEMNGFEFLDELRKNADFGKIPFIYMSASVQEKEKQQAIDKGIDGFIQKPFTEEILIKTISAALK